MQIAQDVHDIILRVADATDEREPQQRRPGKSLYHVLEDEDFEKVFTQLTALFRRFDVFGDGVKAGDASVLIEMARQPFQTVRLMGVVGLMDRDEPAWVFEAMRLCVDMDAVYELRKQRVPMLMYERLGAEADAALVAHSFVRLLDSSDADLSRAVVLVGDFREDVIQMLARLWHDKSLNTTSATARALLADQLIRNLDDEDAATKPREWLAEVRNIPGIPRVVSAIHTWQNLHGCRQVQEILQYVPSQREQLLYDVLLTEFLSLQAKYIVEHCEWKEYMLPAGRGAVVEEMLRQPD